MTKESSGSNEEKKNKKFTHLKCTAKEKKGLTKAFTSN